MTTLLFMGLANERESFRCRVYGVDTDKSESQRIAFVRALATHGAIESPAYDQWIAALVLRGYIDDSFEPADEKQLDGREPWKVRRWKLNDAGRTALADVLEER